MFDVIELSVAEYHTALLEKRVTCKEVVSIYLERITTFDEKLRSFIHLSQDCLKAAQKLDLWLEDNPSDKLPTLFGVPIILKDTYTTYGLPTTVGSRSLRGLKSTDAFVVKKLRDAGAVIIGKGNVHELCLQGCTFSSLGLQTLNPYDLARTPGGSSGGTAAAVAANLAMLGCGGDTINSIRSPSSACNLVGLRPTMGQISRAGVVPVTWSQDAIGPIGRTVQDVRTLFEVMRGEDPDDEITGDQQRNIPAAMPRERKPRIGLLRSYFPGPESLGEAHIVQEVMEEALRKLTEIATFVDVAEDGLPIWFDVPTLLSEVDVQEFEMRTAVDKFFSSKHVLETPHRTLASVAASGDYDQRALTDVFWNTLKPGIDTTNPAYQGRLKRMTLLHEVLRQRFREQNLDAIAFPHQRRLVMEIGTRNQLDRNGILASLTGCPSLCIPAGFSSPTKEAPLGVPIGIELIGNRWDDFKLLDIGKRLMEILQTRKPPILGSN